MKFAEKVKSHMKVDADPLHVADTNYTEPVEINMLDMVECGGEEAKEVKGSNMDGKQATEGLTDKISFDTLVENIPVGNAESEAIEGSVGGITEATEGLRVKFEKIRIAEGPSLRINMVDLKQPSPEMEEVEGCLKMEKEQMNFGYPKANETLREYLWRCH